MSFCKCKEMRINDIVPDTAYTFAEQVEMVLYSVCSCGLYKNDSLNFRKVWTHEEQMEAVEIIKAMAKPAKETSTEQDKRIYDEMMKGQLVLSSRERNELEPCSKHPSWLASKCSRCKEEDLLPTPVKSQSPCEHEWQPVKALPRVGECYDLTPEGKRNN